MSGTDFVKLQNQVGFYEQKMGLEICDFVFEPTFMVGEKMIPIFRALVPEVETRTLALFPLGGNGQGINYWIPYLPPADCLNIRRDGCYVRTENLRGRSIVKYEGKREARWLFSLAAAEQILARGPMGGHFVKLPVAGKDEML